jgi:ADP-heptose:LPS heptosyltransferase
VPAAQRGALILARHPVAYFPLGIGDHFHCLPALRALAAAFPGRLTLLGRARYRALFFSDLRLGRICELDERDARSTARAVGRCDLLLCVDPDPESRLAGRLARQLGHPASIGWAAWNDIRLGFDGARHFSDQTFDVPRALRTRWRLRELAYPPRLPAAALRAAKRVRARLPRGMRVLAVHAETHPRKAWPPARFARVLDAFFDRYHHVMALVMGESGFRLDHGRHRERVIPCHGLPLATSIALVSAADAFLGVDSSMLHAADFFGVPAVGLFSDGALARRWGCHFGRHTHVCGRGTMRSIDDDEVLYALKKRTPGLSSSYIR